MVSSYESDNLISRIQQAGAHAFISKKSGKKEVTDCLHVVGGGNYYISPEIINSALREHINRKDEVFTENAPFNTELWLVIVIEVTPKTRLTVSPGFSSVPPVHTGSVPLQIIKSALPVFLTGLPSTTLITATEPPGGNTKS